MIAETLQKFEQMDVILSLSETGNLEIDSPKNSLTAADINFLKEHKPEIILELSNVFETDSGRRIIEYLIKSEDAGMNLYYHIPTSEAYQTEINLIRSIKFHNERSIADEALKAVCNDYLDTHRRELDTNNFQDWTNNIPLFSLVAYSQGKRIDSFVCNVIQIQIIRALLKAREKGVITKIIPLSED
ncbi:MAG: hypothetical protein M3405_16485 [Acidobacteriota bacterium]|nr:hypothetical protein [Acidobacteriota bacterium]